MSSPKSTNWTEKTTRELFALPTRSAVAPTPRTAPIAGRIVGWAAIPWYSVIINAAMILGSLALVTWFAAVHAGFVSLQIWRRSGDDRVWTNFWRTFRSDLGAKSIMGGAAAVVLAALLINISFLQGKSARSALVFYVINVALLIMTVVILGGLLRTYPARRTERLRVVLATRVAAAIRPNLAHVVAIVGLVAAIAISGYLPLVGVLSGGAIAVWSLHFASFFDRVPQREDLPHA